MFNDIRYKRIISYATELGLVVVVHAGVDIGLPSVTHCTPDMVCEVLDEVQPERLVLAHMGGWNLWDEVLAKLCGRNVYMDTAFSYGEIAWLSGADQSTWSRPDRIWNRQSVDRSEAGHKGHTGTSVIR